ASDLSRMICFPCLEKHEPTLAKALEILYAKNSGLREFWHAEQEKNWTVEPRIVVRPVDQETADFLNSPDAEELLNAIPGIVADMEKEKRDIALRCDFCSDRDLQPDEVRVTEEKGIICDRCFFRIGDPGQSQSDIDAMMPEWEAMRKIQFPF